MNESMATVTLKPREEKRLRSGHLWIFSNEIAEIQGEAAIGSLVHVQASHGHFLGAGLYNPHSLIAVRMTSREDEPVNADWFRSRIARALDVRQTLYPGSTTYRLIHSESDGIPGVIVDRFDHVFSVQISCAGMEQRREMLYGELMELEGVHGIVERNDSNLRTLEGLPERTGLVRGTAEAQIISDGILRYHVDGLSGQKTGFYLDQRENRLAMRRYMTRGRVLDLYSNSGGFALHAIHAGADEVIAVDSSEEATSEIKRNRTLNELPPITIQTTDVFAELMERKMDEERFDAIIADPPPFARSKKHVSAARKKYVDLFSRSLELLAPGGVGFFATCSHHISTTTFHEILRESFRKARRSGIILEERGAAPDHPVHPVMPETSYFHGVILRAD